ncbi:hypothetical protein NM688_g7545 [Phlebia brevispora]|uniref:Uncharacterized protein n=1 Tax=Phlebia brevispora TaxID=194682 RepID=A0ACC1S417_9APHY|nr:hypothetical protein NM688_g7545 [Phlebia brevispora]
MTTSFKDRNLIAVIGDEVPIEIACIGHVDRGKKNFLVVDSKTQVSTIEAAFQEYTERKDIAILLINQHIAEKIRPTVDKYQQAFPALLEIPSKDHPYDFAAVRSLERLDTQASPEAVRRMSIPAHIALDMSLDLVM